MKDKIAVVTGAASGIGRATAQLLAEAGAQGRGRRHRPAQGRGRCRGTAQGRLERRVPARRHDEGRIDHRLRPGGGARKVGAVDILVNGAGWGSTKPFWEGTPELWDKLIALNFVGPMQLTKALLPAMMERGSGRIVNIASDAGRVGSLGETVYSAAKGGLIAFTKSLARETARHGINVNCVCPGPTDTPLLAAVPEKILDAFKKAIPLRRFARPSEIADAVVFFAGERASYITGQVLSVSGGLTMAG